MKLKCPECGTGKARRLCRRRDGAEICSACCASIRDAECEGCVHYAPTQQYEENRVASAAGLPAGYFMMEVSPEVQEAVNGALETAQRGGFESAMDTLTALLHDHPRHHDVPYGIGLVHALKREYKESIAWFDRAIGIYPDSVAAHFNKAVSYQKLLDVPNSIRTYQKVVAIGPANDPEVANARSIVEDMAAVIRRKEGISLGSFLRAGEKFNEAFLHMDRGDWRGALKEFRASAALNKTNAPCHGNIGICLAYLGHKTEALAALDRALEIDPQYDPALTNRNIVAQMTEGKPLENTRYESINFSKENFLKNQRDGNRRNPA